MAKTKNNSSKVKKELEALSAAAEKNNMKRFTLAKKRLKIVCEELFLNLVAAVEIEYDGEGDSGDITDIVFRDANGDLSKYEPPQFLKDTLMDSCYVFLPAGFEIDWGGFGVLNIDTRKNQIEITHSARCMETSTEVMEYEF